MEFEDIVVAVVFWSQKFVFAVHTVWVRVSDLEVQMEVKKLDQLETPVIAVWDELCNLPCR